MSQANNITSNDKTPSLSAEERERWEELKGVVRKNFGAYVETGLALSEIRDKRLYRDEFGTFEGFCKEVLDQNRTAVIRWIDSAKVVDEMSPMGDNLPANARQARELIPVPPEQRQEVWSKVVEKAEEKGAPVTAKLVRNVARELNRRVSTVVVPDEPAGSCVDSVAPVLPVDTGELGDADADATDSAESESAGCDGDGSSTGIVTEEMKEEWVDGVISLRILEKGLGELSKSSKNSPAAAVAQQLLRSFAVTANGATAGVDPAAARVCVVQVARKLWEIAQKP